MISGEGGVILKLFDWNGVMSGHDLHVWGRRRPAQSA